MLPGKKYTPEDVIKILRKRFWVVVVPWAIIAAATAGVARKLPDMYRAAALIQVVPPQVPASIVRPANTQSLDQRLQAIQQTILSRTRLEQLMNEFTLYEAERKTDIMEEVVQNMRNDIQVNPYKGDVFSVQYIGRNAVTVMKVTERLAGFFNEESLRQRSLQAVGTNSFVESQVDDARRKLKDTEDRLKDYKMTHSGELPTQQPANMQAIQSINQNLNNLAQALANDQNNKGMLERFINSAEQQADPTASSAPPPPVGPAAQNLARAKAELAMLRLKYSEIYPGIQRLKEMISKLEKDADAEALQVSPGVGTVVSPAEKARLAQLAGWREDLERVKNHIEVTEAEQKKQKALALSYQAKIDTVPTREAELFELNRDYDTLNRIYQARVAEREASNASVDLEGRQMGEQFVLLDAARLPERPFSPDRVLINFFGVAAGLAVGLALVALLEYRDRTFKTDYEAASVLSLPILAVVPLMRSDAERRAQFRKQLFLNVGLGGTVLVCLAVLTYSFVFVR